LGKVRRLLVRRAHVDPDNAPLFLCRVSEVGDAFFELPLGSLVRHVHAVAVDVELPAVIHAAKPAFLVPPEEQWRELVKTKRPDDPDLAGRVPKGHEILAEQTQPDWYSVGFWNL
jgi:hypothetical protein